MRFSSLVVLAGSVSSGDLISAKSRFLIQSVVKKRAEQTFSSYEEDRVSKGEFCQPALSLVTTSGTEALEIYTKQSQAASLATGKLQAGLQDMSDDIGNDRVRSATEFKETWTESINKEIDELLKSFKSVSTLYKDDKAHSELLRQGLRLPDDVGSVFNQRAEGSDMRELLVGGGLIEHFPVLPGKGSFSETGEEHQLATKSSGLDEIVGSRSHKDSTWGDMISHFGAANTDLEDLVRRVQNRKAEVDKVIEDHEKYAKTDGNFILRRVQGDEPNIDAADDGMLDSYDWNTFSDDESGSVQLAQRIVTLIAKASQGKGKKEGGQVGDYLKDFREFIQSPAEENGRGFISRNPVEQMDRLTTTLSALRIRQLGIKDAINSIQELGQAVNAQMRKITQGYIDSDPDKPSPEDQSPIMFDAIQRIQGDLEKVRPLADLVYSQAVLLPEIKLDDSETVDAFVSTYSDLFKNDNVPNAHNEILPLTNMVVNVVRRLHVHLFGFVQVVGNSEYFKGRDNKLAEIAFGSRKVETDDTRISKVLRVPAQCLLYARVDALLLRHQMKDDQEPSRNYEASCSEMHKAGLESLKGRQSGDVSGAEIRNSN